MPEITVTFPDGHKQTFTGPANLSDTEAYVRAVQERGVQEGRIQTTFAGGAAKALGKDRSTIEALVSAAAVAAGALTGGTAAPPIVAAAPLVSRGVEYATDKLTGGNPSVSVPDVAVDAVRGAVTGYGPGAVAKGAKAVAGAVSRLPVAGLPSWAVRESAPALAAPAAAVGGALDPAAVSRNAGGMVREGAGALRDVVSGLERRALQMRAGVTADDVELAKQSIAQGMKPDTAIRIVFGKNASRVDLIKRLLAQP
jgi:hypothetical protein